MNEFDFSVLTAGEPAQFGKYGSLRLRYLKENKPALYQALLQGNFLNDESVKLSNPILWVQKMNSFKNIAEETVMRDLIYC